MIKDTSKQMAKVAVEALKEKKEYERAGRIIDQMEELPTEAMPIRCRLWLTMLKSRCTRLALMTLR